MHPLSINKNVYPNKVVERIRRNLRFAFRICDASDTNVVKCTWSRIFCNLRHSLARIVRWIWIDKFFRSSYFYCHDVVFGNIPEMRGGALRGCFGLSKWIPEVKALVRAWWKWFKRFAAGCGTHVLPHHWRLAHKEIHFGLVSRVGAKQIETMQVLVSDGNFKMT